MSGTKFVGYSTQDSQDNKILNSADNSDNIKCIGKLIVGGSNTTTTDTIEIDGDISFSTLYRNDNTEYIGHTPGLSTNNTSIQTMTAPFTASGGITGLYEGSAPGEAVTAAQVSATTTALANNLSKTLATSQTMNGNIDMNSNKITGLASGSGTDIARYDDLLAFNHLVVYDTTASQTINGNIDMNSNKITGLPVGSAPGEAVTADQASAATTAMNNYLLKTGGNMTGNIDMNSKKITGLASGSGTDIARYEKISDWLSRLLKSGGNNMTGDIDMGTTKKITGLAAGTHAGDSVTVNQATAATTAMASRFKLDGSEVMTGDIDMGTTKKIKGLASGSGTDIARYEDITDWQSSLLKIGGNMTGDIDMGTTTKKITGLAAGGASGEAITADQVSATTTAMASRFKLDGSEVMTGDIDMGTTKKIKGLASGSGTDIARYEDIPNCLYLSGTDTGSPMTGDIDMGTTKKITGLPEGEAAGEAITAAQASTATTAMASRFKKIDTRLGNIDMDDNKITGLAAGTHAGDSVTAAQASTSTGEMLYRYKKNGSIQMLGYINMNSDANSTNEITGLAEGGASGEAITAAQASTTTTALATKLSKTLSTSQTMNGDINMGGKKITGLKKGIASGHAIRYQQYTPQQSKVNNNIPYASCIFDMKLHTEYTIKNISLNKYDADNNGQPLIRCDFPDVTGGFNNVGKMLKVVSVGGTKTLEWANSAFVERAASSSTQANFNWQYDVGTEDVFPITDANNNNPIGYSGLGDFGPGEYDWNGHKSGTVTTPFVDHDDDIISGSRIATPSSGKYIFKTDKGATFIGSNGSHPLFLGGWTGEHDDTREDVEGWTVNSGGRRITDVNASGTWEATKKYEYPSTDYLKNDDDTYAASNTTGGYNEWGTTVEDYDERTLIEKELNHCHKYNNGPSSPEIQFNTSPTGDPDHYWTRVSWSKTRLVVGGYPVTYKVTQNIDAFCPKGVSEPIPVENKTLWDAFPYATYGFYHPNPMTVRLIFKHADSPFTITQNIGGQLQNMRTPTISVTNNVSASSETWPNPMKVQLLFKSGDSISESDGAIEKIFVIDPGSAADATGRDYQPGDVLKITASELTAAGVVSPTRDFQFQIRSSNTVKDIMVENIGEGKTTWNKWHNKLGRWWDTPPPEPDTNQVCGGWKDRSGQSTTDYLANSGNQRPYTVGDILRIRIPSTYDRDAHNNDPENYINTGIARSNQWLEFKIEDIRIPTTNWNAARISSPPFRMFAQPKDNHFTAYDARFNFDNMYSYHRKVLDTKLEVNGKSYFRNGRVGIGEVSIIKAPLHVYSWPDQHKDWVSWSADNSFDILTEFSSQGSAVGSMNNVSHESVGTGWLQPFAMHIDMDIHGTLPQKVPDGPTEGGWFESDEASIKFFLTWLGSTRDPDIYVNKDEGTISVMETPATNAPASQNPPQPGGPPGMDGGVTYWDEKWAYDQIQSISYYNIWMGTYNYVGSNTAGPPTFAFKLNNNNPPDATQIHFHRESIKMDLPYPVNMWGFFNNHIASNSGNAKGSSSLSLFNWPGNWSANADWWEIDDFMYMLKTAGETGGHGYGKIRLSVRDTVGRDIPDSGWQFYRVSENSGYVEYNIIAVGGVGISKSGNVWTLNVEHIASRGPISSGAAGPTHTEAGYSTPFVDIGDDQESFGPWIGMTTIGNQRNWVNVEFHSADKGLGLWAHSFHGHTAALPASSDEPQGTYHLPLPLQGSTWFPFAPFQPGEETLNWHNESMHTYNLMQTSHYIGFWAGKLGYDLLLFTSDKRIKTNIADLNPRVASFLLRYLKPKKYQYIDKVARGHKSVYGFIAQDVFEIIPRAITIDKRYVPNIYEKAKIVGDVITLTNKDTSDLSVNINIKLYTDQEVITSVIEIIDSKNFKIKSTLKDGDIWVYGTYVIDFLTLNKETIWTITTAAIQDADRELQEQKTKVASLENNLANLLERLASLESN